jgi:pyridoxamine 5'-phosphate oxidase
MDLFDLREEYSNELLDEASVPTNPQELFQMWFKQAQDVKIYEPNAFVLATADKNSTPQARVLLLKAYNDLGLSFFTNYNSNKGKQLFDNPQAAMVFYWGELERQVRITGGVEQLPEIESDKYFETRPIGSRLGAWASPQSQVIENRSWLEAKHFEFRQQFKHGEVPRPKNWGGYILIPDTIEFWQGRPNRLHDRIEYFRDGEVWKIRRLAP